MNGLLVIDKPEGMSSHSVVNVVRRLTGQKRVGHAGTLDPMATGVLVVCVGQAVRLSEYLIDHDKKYRARARLGVETDTYDATGQAVATHEVNVTPEAITAALNSFVGKISQRPPAHSAVQRDGVRAYQLARRGVALEMEPREVEIYSIKVRAAQGDKVEFDVHCSKGTFIRSLAHDLGEKLGTGAHLSALTRLASGRFTIEQSAPLDELKDAAARGELERYLLPMDRAIAEFDTLTLDVETAQAVRNGRFIPAPYRLKTPIVRAYNSQGELIALLEPVGPNALKPKKVFES